MNPLLTRTEIFYHLFCRNVNNVLWVVINNVYNVCSICRLASTCKTANHIFETMDVWSCRFRKSGYKNIRNLHACVALSLQSKFIEAQDFAFIHSCLRIDQIIVNLYLNNNNICDKGCEYITNSNLLHTLRHLSVSNNNITDKGGRLLITSCENGILSCIHEINVSNNIFSQLLYSLFKKMHHPNHMFVSV